MNATISTSCYILQLIISTKTNIIPHLLTTGHQALKLIIPIKWQLRIPGTFSSNAASGFPKHSAHQHRTPCIARCMTLKLLHGTGLQNAALVFRMVEGNSSISLPYAIRTNTIMYLFFGRVHCCLSTWFY